MTIAAPPRTDWIEVARELGPRFAARASAHDRDDRFVDENYAELRRQRVFSAGVPAELGGGGASYRELCELLRLLAHSCSSTALALAMHTHTLANAVWRWRHAGAPFEPFLRRVAGEELVLVTSGGSDFLASSGTAKKVDGGYRVAARKIFSSGSPGGDVLMTTAVYDDPNEGPTVLHFPIALSSPGVSVADNWRALGMRGTGSNDVLLENIFVPDGSVGARRPAGRWSPLMFVVYSIAFPLVYCVYLGVAEAARDIALREAGRRRDDRNVQALVGEMENELATARMAVRHMIDAADSDRLGPEAANAVIIGRTLACRAAIRATEKAVEVAGGSAFYRSLGLERLFRDIQAARFHPLQEKPQTIFTGRLALGLDPDG
jgi:alkylation response protein AidB-like acyl-CoA dehydrogenase